MLTDKIHFLKKTIIKKHEFFENSILFAKLLAYSKLIFLKM